MHQGTLWLKGNKTHHGNLNKLTKRTMVILKADKTHQGIFKAKKTHQDSCKRVTKRTRGVYNC